ncbi:alpha/beta hydrolase [Streptomyces sp. NPDC048295]|uniref:alpha/beta hydrolase n=1 Tax=Streptomyces sp. NPDC048295 TaxID=3154617 RepID=UPI0034164D59
MVAKTFLRHLLKSAVVVGAAATAIAVSVAVPAVHASAQPSEPKPTVVLVHGAFVDASEWDSVIGSLQHVGYQVVAPANPLRGLASGAAYLRSFLNTIQGPIVLAGHSYGGAVMTEAAAGDPQVKALVYIAAFALAKGENVNSLGAKFPATALSTALTPTPYPLPDGGTGVELYVQPAKFHEVAAADAPAAIAAAAAAAQRPVAASVFAEKTTAAAWKTIPSWDLITTQDQAINPAEQEFMAKRAHAHIEKIVSSHAVTLTHADAVTEIIEQAAGAVSR